MLLPPDLRDWVSDDHIVHFIIDAVDQLPRECFKLNLRGTVDEQYSPRMMLALLIYYYADRSLLLPPHRACNRG